MDVQAVIGTDIIKNASPVTFTLNTWVEVTAGFIILDDVPFALASINIGNINAVYKGYPSPSIRSTDFKTTDKVRIGGFLGHIADLRIYSPGALYMGTDTCTSGCPYELGTTNPATCFKPECDLGIVTSPSCLSKYLSWHLS